MAETLTIKYGPDLQEWSHEHDLLASELMSSVEAFYALYKNNVVLSKGHLKITIERVESVESCQ